MTKCVSLLVHVVVLCATSMAWAGPVTVFDLRYTLKIDTNDPVQVQMAWEHCHAVAALQGLVNRDTPRLYVRFVDSQHRRRNVDDYWLAKATAQGGWLEGSEIREIDDIVNLVRQFGVFVRGTVVYDPAAVAGAEDLLPIRYDTSPESLYSRLVVSGPFTSKGMIPGTQRQSTGSAKCDAYLWMKIHYMDTGKCDGAYGAYYLDQYWMKRPRNSVLNHHCLTNHDFFIGRKAFFFDLHVWGDETPIDDPDQKVGTDMETLKELLLSAYEYGKVISAYNGFMDADAIGYGAMANASFYQHFPLKSEYPQKWVTAKQLAERGYLTEDAHVNFDGREFLVFYVGDYDCAAWLYQRMMDIWDDPNRGKIPMMWCISPVLDRRAPMAMDYIRRTATAYDYFASADNGAGYCEPGMLQEPRGISNLPSGLDAWAQHSKRFYDRWGLSITGFIIYAHGPILNKAGLDCYASFSPNGIVPSGGPANLLHKDMPVLRFDHDVNEGSAEDAAAHVVRRITQRRKEGHPPFHWFRNILKTPTWYVNTYDEIRKSNPKIELLDAPTFFELYRIYLKNRK